GPSKRPPSSDQPSRYPCDMAVVPTPTMTPASTSALPTKKERQRLRRGAAGTAGGVSRVLMQKLLENRCRPFCPARSARFRRNFGCVKKCEAAQDGRVG